MDIIPNRSPWNKRILGWLMSLSKIPRIRWTRILIMTLYRTLQHEIGRNSATTVGLLTLGINEIKVELTCFSSLPVAKNSKIACVTSPPTTGQAALKKPAEYPSGPGALVSSI
ncbi:UNVERIFIED_CONTAM: hypothetical protein Slati_2449000 [Sesamum latifolium]|uniref:Uncharacterized protein n=1 Tax=Sesamum latifolium TaxID=2727402 RepID=A0AAW2WD37_9LAMI